MRITLHGPGQMGTPTLPLALDRWYCPALPCSAPCPTLPYPKPGQGVPPTPLCPRPRQGPRTTIPKPG